MINNIKHIAPIELHVREVQCLYWAGRDKGVRGTAEVLNVSVDTVKSYRKMLLSKLGCRTITGALYIAMKNDLLQS